MNLKQLYDRLLKGNGRSSYDRVCDHLAAYDRICVFGMGNYGQEILPTLKERLGERLICVCDNDAAKHGKEYLGLRCVSPDDLLFDRDNIHIFVAVYIAHNIISDLSKRGFDVINTRLNRDAALAFRNTHAYKLYSENWKRLEETFSLLADDWSRRVFLSRIRYNMFPEDFEEYDDPMSDVYSGDQYFPEDIIRLTDEEIFVDGGAYIGDTLQLFLAKTGNRFERAYLFELDKENYLNLNKSIVRLAPDVAVRVKAYHCGLWNCTQELNVSGSGSGVHISGEGAYSEGQQYQLDALDNVLSKLERSSVTYVKMDIEGSERNALLGARNTIARNRPKLAICVYHKPEDIYEIPLLIHEMASSYKLYLRHHGRDWLYANETVCYAV